MKATIKSISAHLQIMKEKEAKIENEKGLLQKSNPELRVSESWEGVRATRTENGFIETIPPMYFGFALHV